MKVQLFRNIRLLISGVILWGILFVRDVIEKCRPSKHPFGAVVGFLFIYSVGGFLAHAIFIFASLSFALMIWWVMLGANIIYLGFSYDEKVGFHAQNHKTFIAVLTAVWAIVAVPIIWVVF